MFAFFKQFFFRKEYSPLPLMNDHLAKDMGLFEFKSEVDLHDQLKQKSIDYPKASY